MKKRQLIYLPEINPDSFVLLFSKGESGDSYSIREYSPSGGIEVRYADSFPYSFDELLSLAKHRMDAPTHRMDDEDFWRNEIRKLNQRHLLRSGDRETSSTESTPGALETIADHNSKMTTETNPAPVAFHIISKDDNQIMSVDDWFQFAPPKMGEHHWKDGRSAKELAKSWFRSGTAGIPEELQRLLEGSAVTRGFVPELAIPEFVTRLDDFLGEHRNHDLVLVGVSDENKVLVSIEAKADEPFGDEIYRIKSRNPRSNVSKRIELLSRAIFGRISDDDLGQLRYQLLTGIAGALIEAKNRKADYAVFVLHEFVSSELDPAQVKGNAEDLDNFLRKMTGQKDFHLSSGQLAEIGHVPGSKFVPRGIPLSIGKVSTETG